MSSQRLTPRAIARDLFVIEPDRDERASQICAETLLTLQANNYALPSDTDNLKSPKRRRFALRSLSIGENFLVGRGERIGTGSITETNYGSHLSLGQDFNGSENLSLGKQALEGLVDPSTTGGQKGTWLLYPFHESFLWFDARLTFGRPWAVRKVYMRGSGITLARLLLHPPADENTKQQGTKAVAALAKALREPSQLADMAIQLERVLNGDGTAPKTEKDEIDSWEDGANSKLTKLSEALCHHVLNIMEQGEAGSTAKLWSFRNILGLDLAISALRSAWDATSFPDEDRFLLLTFGGPPRAENFVRQRSEESFKRGRICLREATIQTLARKMSEISDDVVNWADEFEGRSDLDELANQLDSAEGIHAYETIARSAFEQANYSRSVDGIRVLIESIGMLQGTGQYRYLSATPTLLSAMVGALSSRMPMSSQDFFQAVFDEWNIVISPETAKMTSLLRNLDGSELSRNARRAEAFLVDSGLAVALSDSTTIVGERAGRRI